jgi:hypothetical protein
MSPPARLQVDRAVDQGARAAADPDLSIVVLADMHTSGATEGGT